MNPQLVRDLRCLRLSGLLSSLEVRLQEAQAIGHQAARMGLAVLHRSNFDTVAELMQAEALGEQSKSLARYFRPNLFILEDMGLKKLPA